MSERDFRRRNIPAYRRTISSSRGFRGPRISPESRRKINPEARRNLLRPWESGKILQSSKSEPLLWRSNVGVAEEEEATVLYRRQTCRNIFTPRLASAPQSPRNCPQGYNRESKVVVNVTVEGSPGAVRTMVKLGSSVEETIKLVLDKYNEEGRTPPLPKHASPKFQLHHSYFSIHSLNKLDLIGEIGGNRNFYLRSNGDVFTPSNQPMPPPSPSSLSPVPSFIGRKIATIIRITRKFWKLLGCIP